MTFTGEFDPFCEDDVCFSEVAFGIHYWTSLADDDLACTQRLVAAASVTLGFGGVPGCGNCSAGFAIDPDSWIDATDPDDDPAHCDLAALNAADLNYGEAFTAPAGSFPGALGDFNAGGFQSAGVHAALNHDYYAAGGLTAEAMTAAYADLGLVYAGLIFWDGSIDDSAAQSLLDAGLFVPEGESAAFVPAFFVWFDPEENPAADPDEATGWIGPHGASSTFLFDVQ